MNRVNIDLICITLHGAIKAFGMYNGDFSLGSWEYERPSIKDTTRRIVEHFMDNPLMTAWDLHDYWMRMFIEDGWKYGEIKDFHLKTSPRLVPYEKLSENEKLKDYIVLGIIHGFVTYQDVELL